MIFHIQHTSTYRYERPVFLEPHVIRLCPRGTGAQRVLRYVLEIEPEPTGLSYGLDVYGNSFAYAWFNDMTDRLVIRADLNVRTYRANPYDFYFDPSDQAFPVEYDDAIRPHLQVYRQTHRSANLNDEMRQFTDLIVDQADGVAAQFLPQLCLRLNRLVKTIHREQGPPMTAKQTWQQREGACRDIAVLFIELCRYMGLAARFVTGYQEGDKDADRRELHAWAEVFLPGIGWRGHDPTLGIAVADRHVTLAAADIPSGAAAVTGRYRGTGVDSSFDADIAMRLENDPPSIPRQRPQAQTQVQQ